MLKEYAAAPYAQENYGRELVLDRERDRYLLLTTGWDGRKRVYGTDFHLEIRDGEIWIQCNNTNIEPAPELVRAGVPKEHIVIGLLPPDVRADTDCAVA